MLTSGKIVTSHGHNFWRQTPYVRSSSDETHDALLMTLNFPLDWSCP